MDNAFVLAKFSVHIHVICHVVWQQGTRLTL